MRQRDRSSLTDVSGAGYDPHHGAHHSHHYTGGRHDVAHDPAHDSAHDSAHDAVHDGGSLLDDYESTEVDDGRVRTGGRRSRSSRAEHGRSGRRAHERRRRNRRTMWIFSILFVIVVGLVAWLVVPPIYRLFAPAADYSGSGQGSVLVTVQANDDASQIGDTLHKDGVVASVAAFTDAADSNSRSQSIQPGAYRLHRRMSGTSALNLLLSPSSRVNADVLVAEGMTVVDVEKRLAVAACSSTALASKPCGPGLTRAQVAAAVRNTSALGIPTDYLDNGKAPKSAEGFLFPATYYFPNKTSATDALSQMVNNFTDQVRELDFTASARALKLTPYQALTVASIAQSEAKYASDFPKVARVLLNRLAQHIPLRVDATSAYAAKLAGKNPATIIYAKIISPYNSYTHPGLPPTPVGNPGVEALKGAAHPATGKWLFYVNDDAEGHLGFYDTEAQFEAAAAKCRANHWGCG